jgi:hypothetical protein
MAECSAVGLTMVMTAIDHGVLLGACLHVAASASPRYLLGAISHLDQTYIKMAGVTAQLMLGGRRSWIGGTGREGRKEGSSDMEDSEEEEQ